MADVYILKEEIEALALVNDSGAAVAQGEFSVFGSLPVVAKEAIASGARGPVDVQAFKVLRTTDLHETENTFNTDNQLVYYDPTTLTFSDTEQADYYIVGQLKTLKGTNTYMEFVVFPTAELVTT